MVTVTETRNRDARLTAMTFSGQIHRVKASALFVILLAGCGGDSTNEATPPSDPTTTIDLRADYIASVEALATEAEDIIHATPDNLGNDGGYGTVANTYAGLASALDRLSPPPGLEIAHGALVSEAEAIAEDAEEVANIPALSVGPDGLPRMGNRIGPGVGLAERRAAFRQMVSELTDS
jgi:hypothetical protein